MNHHLNKTLTVNVEIRDRKLGLYVIPYAYMVVRGWDSGSEACLLNPTNKSRAYDVAQITPIPCLEPILEPTSNSKC